MRHMLLGAVFCLALAFPAFAAGSGAELTLKDDQIYLTKDGKSTPLSQEEFPAQPIDDTKLRFLGLGPDTAKAHGLAPGLYIFENQGGPIAFAPTDEAEFCADVKIAPDGNMLAMDAGMALVRNWFFFSFPEMEPMGAADYYQIPDRPALIWIEGKGALFSSMDVDKHNRACGYDPCGPVSVSYYDFKAGRSTRLLPGTDLCDYALTGLAEDGLTATAEALCLPSAKDWETFPEDKPTEKVDVKLP